MSLSELFELKVVDVSSNTTMTLGQLRDTHCNSISGDGSGSGSKALAIDFWHTKCVRCPAALSKLNEEAPEMSSKCVFIACAISQGEGNLDVVRDVTSEWENIVHVFMEQDVKEQAKRILGFTSVPFVAVYGAEGHLLGSGDPKSVSVQALLTTANKPTGGLLFDDDF
jgi:hypothetical protein